MTHTYSFFKKAILTMLIAAAIIVTMPITTLAASTGNTNVTVTARLDYDQSTKVLNLVNKQRAKAGLKALSMDKALLYNATTRAEECSIYYNHTRPNNKEWKTAVAKTYKKAAENIAFGFDDAEEVVAAWMKSAGHKKNIMNPNYTCIGIGCVEVDGETFWAQEFTDGSPQKVTCKGHKTYNTNISVAASRLAVGTKSKKVSLAKGSTMKAVLDLRNYGYNGFTTAVAKSTVKYATSNKNVATIDSNGVIRAVGKGTATVTLTLVGNTNIKKTYTITVK